MIEQADEPSDDPINDTLAHQMVVVSGGAHILERVLGLEFWLIKPPVAGSHVLVRDSLLVRHASGWRPVPHERYGYYGLSAGDAYLIADSIMSTIRGVTEVLDPDSGDTVFCSGATEVDSAILGGVYLQSWVSHPSTDELGREHVFGAGMDGLNRRDHETGEWVPAEEAARIALRTTESSEPSALTTLSFINRFPRVASHRINGTKNATQTNVTTSSAAPADGRTIAVSDERTATTRITSTMWASSRFPSDAGQSRPSLRSSVISVPPVGSTSDPAITLRRLCGHRAVRSTAARVPSESLLHHRPSNSVSPRNVPPPRSTRVTERSDRALAIDSCTQGVERLLGRGEALGLLFAADPAEQFTDPWSGGYPERHDVATREERCRFGIGIGWEQSSLHVHGQVARAVLTKRLEHRRPFGGGSVSESTKCLVAERVARQRGQGMSDRTTSRRCRFAGAEMLGPPKW